MPVQPIDIFTYFNVQRFVQAGSMDAANWYNVEAPGSKYGKSLYPAMGRRHVVFNGVNQLIFDAQPKYIFRSINFVYVFVGTRVFQFDQSYNVVQISDSISLDGIIWFAYLNVVTTTYCMFTDGTNIYVITEPPSGPPTIQVCTDTNAPLQPTYIAAFGGRFVVASLDSPTFYITQINLGGVPIANPNSWFTIPDAGPGYPLFAQATGVIRQFGVLNNQMFIFTDFNVDLWANIPTQIPVIGAPDGIASFPYKLNTSTNFNVGIYDPSSLAVNFGTMAWLAQNEDGLVTFVMSEGNQPEGISTQAVNVLLQGEDNSESISPFTAANGSAFLYQWENSIFYRFVGGVYLSDPDIDLQDSYNAIEYNFNTKKWNRVIELNGDRNRITKHIYYNGIHYTILDNDTAIYDMRGNVYTNDSQVSFGSTTFKTEPMRYELITSQIFQEDYSEFITDYIEIDFVYGYMTLPKSIAPFLNTVFITDESGNFIVTESSTPGTETFLIKEGTNTPSTLDTHYNYLDNPHIELYFSDDGGITYSSADVREFSALGKYSWRMRWYQLGPSRNRVYKLVCVSPSPIVILGAVHNIRRASGGAN